MSRMEELKSFGYRQTAPRALVLQVLEQSGGHLTAAQIADAVEAQDLPLNRSTVYRTLDTLVEIGMIKGSQMGRSVAYELLHNDDSHHHLVCTSCNATVHLSGEVTDAALSAEAAAAGFAVSDIQVLISGQCQACAETVPGGAART